LTSERLSYQQHLEKLVIEMTLMRIENQDLKNQLSNGISNQDLKPEPSVAAAGNWLPALSISIKFRRGDAHYADCVVACGPGRAHGVADTVAAPIHNTADTAAPYTQHC